jgi:parallel beta-helix repeat protein
MFLRAFRTALTGSKGKRRASKLTRPPRLEFLEIRATPATFTVDDDLVQKPNADFTTITAALNVAGANDRINVFPGTYNEQLVINSKQNGLQLIATSGNADRTVISPFSFSVDPVAEAVIRVQGATNVTIKGFLITGRDAPTGTGAGANYGVLVSDGGSATVRDNHITQIRDQTLSGVVEGIGIQYGFTDSAGTVLSSASGLARHNVIEDYQKGGIVVIGSASNGDLHDNVIRGSGPTNVIVQNGIQVSDGATADVRNNTVSGNSFLATAPNTDNATGILLFETSKVLVRNNSVSNNGEGIFLFEANDNTVQNNTSSNNNTDGLAMIHADNNTIRNNNFNSNALDGIYVEDATGNTIQNNVCNFNGFFGIELTATTSFNVGGQNQTNGNGLGGIQDDGTNNSVSN